MSYAVVVENGDLEYHITRDPTSGKLVGSLIAPTKDNVTVEFDYDPVAYIAKLSNEVIEVLHASFPADLFHPVYKIVVYAKVGYFKTALATLTRELAEEPVNELRDDRYVVITDQTTDVDYILSGTKKDPYGLIMAGAKVTQAALFDTTILHRVDEVVKPVVMRIHETSLKKGNYTKSYEITIWQQGTGITDILISSITVTIETKLDDDDLTSSSFI